MHSQQLKLIPYADQDQELKVRIERPMDIDKVKNNKYVLHVSSVCLVQYLPKSFTTAL